MEELLTTEPAPIADEVNEAFWQACDGGQLPAAQRLLERGPDLNYHPGYSDDPPIEIAAQVDTRRHQLVEWLQAHGATNAATTSHYRQRYSVSPSNGGDQPW